MKIIHTFVAAAGFVALAACGGGGAEENNMATDANLLVTDPALDPGLTNDMNMTTDMNGMDMNMDMNATDMNMMDANMTMNGTDMNMTEANMMANDMMTNNPDTNLANGM